MATDPLIKRARPPSSLMTAGPLDRALGHPLAFLATIAVLIAVFGWTFFTEPGRPAAADDPAYYSWRTEALLANDPDVLLEADGPFDMYSGGYRVLTPVFAGLLRLIAGVGVLTPTILISVGLRVLIPVLLAGFAYRHRRDPLVWHAVAAGVGSLLLTPPFAGYLDNVMTLMFLSASLYLIEATRTSWAARVGFFALLLASGFTHPTTLAIFCLTLGAMAFIRFVARGFSLRRAMTDDGPMLISAFAAVVTTYAIWKVGIWGESASLTEAALPPPADSGFFSKRLGGWIRAMRPLWNGPLLVIGALGLLVGRRRSGEGELARVTLVWLLPLIGILGVFAGVAYPYYRFFNTTVAWLLLVGLGAFFVGRYSLDVARRGGVSRVALVALAAVGAVLATNFSAGIEVTGWNDPADGWIKPEERAELDVVRKQLIERDARSVVFVVDDEAPEPVRIYGFAKRAGNVSRYGVPDELLDRTAFYLGSLDAYRSNEPTTRDDYYDDLSKASLEDANEVAGRDAVVVLAGAFNETGANAGIDEDDVGSGVIFVDSEDGATGNASGGFPFMALLGLLLLLLPGLLLVRWALPGARWTDALGLAPALSVCALVLVGIGFLAVVPSPLTSGGAWTIFIVTTVLAAIGAAVSFLRGDRGGSLGYTNAS